MLYLKNKIKNLEREGIERMANLQHEIENHYSNQFLRLRNSLLEKFNIERKTLAKQYADLKNQFELYIRAQRRIHNYFI